MIAARLSGASRTRLLELPAHLNATADFRVAAETVEKADVKVLHPRGVIGDAPPSLESARLVFSARQKSDVPFTAGSIVRHGENGAWRCDATQRMRSERYQRCAGLGGEFARDKDGLVERPA
jgi:hypothetical protein